MVQDLLVGLRDVKARPMFGGHGLYLDGTIFSIIADEVLYFKVNETNRKNYESRGSKPFTYESGKGKKVVMSYWEVPAEISEDRDLIVEWARRSAAISRKSKVVSKRLKKRAKKSVFGRILAQVPHRKPLHGDDL